MLDAMTRMMEAMGMVNAPEPAPADPAGDHNWPWLLPFGDPIQTFSFPKPQAQLRLPGSKSGHVLDGLWEDREQGLLIIHGSRFRICQPRSGSIDGIIEQRDNRVILYNPNNRQARLYEFALFEGRLVLRDPEGQLLLYRRLWLDELQK